eukprot:741028-Amphidinium_carterae.2
MHLAEHEGSAEVLLLWVLEVAPQNARVTSIRFFAIDFLGQFGARFVIVAILRCSRRGDLVKCASDLLNLVLAFNVCVKTTRSVVDSSLHRVVLPSLETPTTCVHDLLQNKKSCRNNCPMTSCITLRHNLLHR